MRQKLAQSLRAFLDCVDDSDVDQFLGYLVPHLYYEEQGYDVIAQYVVGHLQGGISEERRQSLAEGAPSTDAEKSILRKAYVAWFPGSGRECHMSWFFGEVADEAGTMWIIARETAGSYFPGNETTNRLLFASQSEMKSFFDMQGQFSGAYQGRMNEHLAHSAG
jgi:hypothetical protein